MIEISADKLGYISRAMKKAADDVGLDLYDFGRGFVVAPTPEGGTLNGEKLATYMFAFTERIDV